MASTHSLPSASSPAQSKFPASITFSPHRRAAPVSFPLPSEQNKPLLCQAKGSSVCRDRAIVANAQKNEVLGGSYNDTAPLEAKAEVPASKGKDHESEKARPRSLPLSDEAISEFMTQVANLVKLVDSRDIVELQLKQPDRELIIRKKEALPQPPAPAPVVMMHAPSPPAVLPSQVQPLSAITPSPSTAGPKPAPPAPPKAAKSSHPSLKSPMAGTFYRSPGPGLPPLVKPGDKVNKGQVLCIIEAMKLMNEIEADHAGSIVEILVEDGKPVGIDQPIFVIEP